MKTKRKADLMLVLALFVFIGVVLSTVSQTDSKIYPANEAEQDASMPTRTQNNDSQQQGSQYQRVSISVAQSTFLS